MGAQKGSMGAQEGARVPRYRRARLQICGLAVLEDGLRITLSSLECRNVTNFFSRENALSCFGPLQGWGAHPTHRPIFSGQL